MSQCSVALATESDLNGPSSTVREGYFTLSLDTERFHSARQTDSSKGVDERTIAVADLNRLHIEQSSLKDFAEVTASFPFLGDFKQISLTGFADGSYWFRARGEDADGNLWYSEPTRVEVKHYPLWQAFGLFASGALMFVVLSYYLLRSHLKVTKRKDA